jgi:YHS domain-containing protein
MQTKRDEALFDPICGKPVDPATSHAVEYKKRTYYFCSAQCKERFERQTERQRMKDLARLGALFARHKVRWGVA